MGKDNGCMLTLSVGQETIKLQVKDNGCILSVGQGTSILGEE